MVSCEGAATPIHAYDATWHDRSSCLSPVQECTPGAHFPSKTSSQQPDIMVLVWELDMITILSKTTRCSMAIQ